MPDGLYSNKLHSSEKNFVCALILMGRPALTITYSLYLDIEMDRYDDLCRTTLIYSRPSSLLDFVLVTGDVLIVLVTRDQL